MRSIRYQAIKSKTGFDISLMCGVVEYAGMKFFPGENYLKSIRRFNKNSKKMLFPFSF